MKKKNECRNRKDDDMCRRADAGGTGTQEAGGGEGAAVVLVRWVVVVHTYAAIK